MKDKRQRKTDYSKLYRKITLKIAITLLIAIAAVLLLRMLTRGKIADQIVGALQYAFSIDFGAAQRIYQYTIRNNLELLSFIAIAICFLVLSRYLIRQFSRYFNEINSGIDVLIKGEDREIELSPEMESMEMKLNLLKGALKKREQDAKLAEQRKNDLVMYLAHDIKTPLTSVIGYLSLLHEAADMPIEQKAKYVHITLDKAYRLEQLIDEFFEITRYNLQTITLSKENIDLYYMLVQMADEFFPQLSVNGKRVAIHASEDLTVYGDPDKLARVFNNILKNAVAYSPANSVIDIAAEVLDDTVSVVFKNIGSIPKDKLTSIFDKFYRLDSARSTETGGAGLGLAVAKEIVVLHGGRIYADSDGGHITFTVELPTMS